MKTFYVVALLFWTLPAQAQNQLGSVNISSLLDLNAILITEVDVIIVYDPVLAENLPANQGDWYRGKYKLLEMGSEKIEVITVSAPQGFVSDFARLPPRHAEAVRVLVSAYHETNGVALHDITAYQRARVEIDSYGILVSGN
ncbi:MAG: hypothetical protein WD772_06180 [Pseudohongiellaceae bacterium]